MAYSLTVGHRLTRNNLSGIFLDQRCRLRSHFITSLHRLQDPEDRAHGLCFSGASTVSPHRWKTVLELTLEPLNVCLFSKNFLLCGPDYCATTALYIFSQRISRTSLVIAAWWTERRYTRIFLIRTVVTHHHSPEPGRMSERTVVSVPAHRKLCIYVPLKWAEWRI